MSATGMVVTPGGSWEGVKFTATGITYHVIVLALKVPRSQLEQLESEHHICLFRVRYDPYHNIGTRTILWHAG